jgi:predicted  nucleic acid-binding Zn-ribbon protein
MNEDRLGELRLAIDAVAKEQQRLEGDIDSIRLKAEAERRRLYDGSVANPKELQSIEAEVQSLRSRQERLEDQVLDQMERREELEARLGPIEAEATETRQRLAEIEETSARELVEVEGALGEREEERKALVPELDEELLELYEELRRQKRGVGAAALVDGLCQGCRQQLSPVYRERLKSEQGLWRCEHCRRILVPG